MKRIRDRVVGKQGYLTRSDKVFEQIVTQWRQQAERLESKGYKIEYSRKGSIPDPTGQYRSMMCITFPDGHREIMSREDAILLY